MASIFTTNSFVFSHLGKFWLRIMFSVVFALIFLINSYSSAFALEPYFGSKSGEPGLCPNPEVPSSCICTEDEVIVPFPIPAPPFITLVPIYRERCVSVPNAFVTPEELQARREALEARLEEMTGSLPSHISNFLMSSLIENTSSTFAYPRVRFAYYLWGSGVTVKHMGVGECEWSKALRHCARLTYGDKQPGEDGYDPSKNYGNSLRLDTSERSESGVPLRLCVFDDPWDFKDTNSDFSPFHKNTSMEEAEKITSNMKANTWSDEKWLGSGSRVVSGWDSFWTIITGGSYNNNVATIVGCAPIPIAPMPPPFCDKCDVLPNVPDPNAALKDGSTFEQPVLLVELSSFQYNYNRNSFELTRTSDVDLPVGQCVPHEGKEYCASYCNNGAEICFFENGETMRVIRYIDRPEFMPLPVIENVTEDAGHPKMKVYFGIDPNVSSGLSYTEKVKAGSEPYTESAILSVNQEDQESEEDEACTILHGVKLCAERECYRYEPDGSCTERSPNICLMGYEPDPFDVAGYHPSKGVLEDIDTGGIAPPVFNSQDGGKIYFDSKEFFSDPDNSLPINLNHRPFTPYELDLCIGGQWRWPAAVNSIHTVPETRTITFDPACTELEVKMWGGGAAGSRVGGHHNINSDYAGGAGAHIEALVPINNNQAVEVTIGSGGSSNGASGTDSLLSIDGVTYLRAGGAVRANGGTTTITAGKNISTIRSLNGASTTFVVSNSTPGAGALAYGQTSGGGQAASACAVDKGHGTKARAPMGSGGCARDDSGGQSGTGSIGLGGHGGISLECTKFADSEPSLPPMPEVSTQNCTYSHSNQCYETKEAMCAARSGEKKRVGSRYRKSYKCCKDGIVKRGPSKTSCEKTLFSF